MQSETAKPPEYAVESSKRLEYEDIPDLEYRKDVNHLLYSAEYSGLRSCQTPPIFQKNMRHIVEKATLTPPRGHPLLNFRGPGLTLRVDLPILPRGQGDP
jgi:hypothetical protein